MGSRIKVADRDPRGRWYSDYQCFLMYAIWQGEEEGITRAGIWKVAEELGIRAYARKDKRKLFDGMLTESITGFITCGGWEPDLPRAYMPGGDMYDRVELDYNAKFKLTELGKEIATERWEEIRTRLADIKARHAAAAVPRNERGETPMQEMYRKQAEKAKGL